MDCLWPIRRNYNVLLRHCWAQFGLKGKVDQLHPQINPRVKLILFIHTIRLQFYEPQIKENPTLDVSVFNILIIEKQHKMSVICLSKMRRWAPVVNIAAFN